MCVIIFIVVYYSQFERGANLSKPWYNVVVRRKVRVNRFYDRKKTFRIMRRNHTRNAKHSNIFLYCLNIYVSKNKHRIL